MRPKHCPHCGKALFLPTDPRTRDWKRCNGREPWNVYGHNSGQLYRVLRRDPPADVIMILSPNHDSKTVWHKRRPITYWTILVCAPEGGYVHRLTNSARTKDDAAVKAFEAARTVTAEDCEKAAKDLERWRATCAEYRAEQDRATAAHRAKVEAERAEQDAQRLRLVKGGVS